MPGTAAFFARRGDPRINVRLILCNRYLVGMRKGSAFIVAATILLAVSLRSIAATSGDAGLEQEYLQVRKIALKDPHVQDAFRKANERLDERILQIDPSLKPIVDRHEAIPEPVKSAKLAPAHPAPAPVAREHIVIKGETLSSIAEHYRVKVVTLEKINHITNDRKLQVGQKLLIPSSGSLETQPAAAAEPSPAAQARDQGLWDRVKSSL